MGKIFGWFIKAAVAYVLFTIASALAVPTIEMLRDWFTGQVQADGGFLLKLGLLLLIGGALWDTLIGMALGVLIASNAKDPRPAQMGLVMATLVRMIRK